MEGDIGRGTTRKMTPEKAGDAEAVREIQQL